MRIRVRLTNHSEVEANSVASTETKDGYFICKDDDGDKLLVVPEQVILYVEYIYDD